MCGVDVYRVHEVDVTWGKDCASLFAAQVCVPCQHAGGLGSWYVVLWVLTGGDCDRMVLADDTTR